MVVIGPMDNIVDAKCQNGGMPLAPRSRLNKAVSASREGLVSLQNSINQRREGSGSSSATSSRQASGMDLLDGIDLARISVDAELLVPLPPTPSISTAKTSMDRRSMNGAEEGGGTPLVGSPRESVDVGDAAGVNLLDDDPVERRQSMQSAQSTHDLEISARLLRLAKFENSFPTIIIPYHRSISTTHIASVYTEIVKAFQVLQKKMDQVEGVIKLGSPLQNGINTTGDLETFASYMREIKTKAETSSTEVVKLSRQVSELKEVQQLEATTKATFFESLQQKIQEQEQEIKLLKSAAEERAIEKPPTQGILFENGEEVTSHEVHQLEIAALRTKVLEQEEEISQLRAISTQGTFENGAEVADEESHFLEVESLRAEIKQRDQEITALKETLAKPQKAILIPVNGSEVNDIEAERLELEALRSSVQRKDEEITSLHTSLEEKANAIKAQESKVSELSAKLSEAESLQSAIQKKDEEIKQLKGVVDEKAAAVKLQQEKLLAETKEREAKISEFENLQKESQKKDEQIKELKTSIQEQIVKAQQTVIPETRTVSVDQEAYRLELEALRSKLSEKEAEIKSLLEQKSISTSSETAPTSIPDSLIVTADQDSLRLELDTLRTKLAEKEEEIKQLKSSTIAPQPVSYNLLEGSPTETKPESSQDGLLIDFAISEPVKEAPVPLPAPLISPAAGPSKELEEALEATKEELANTKQDLKAKEEALVSTKQSLQDLESSLASTKQELQAKDELLASIKVELQTKDELLASTKGELEACQKEVDALKQDIQTRELSASSSSKELQSREDALSAAKNDLLTSQQKLASVQQQLQAQEASFRDLEARQAATLKQFAEEEEKKNKSIQLLRNSKARILKLEEQLKVKEGESAQVALELSEVRASALQGVKERESQMANLTRQIEDMNSRLKKAHEEVSIERDKRQQKEVENTTLTATLKEIASSNEQIRQENQRLQQADEQRKTETEKSKDILELQASQLSMWPQKVEELEHRCTELEAELETSRRLFEVRSAELDAIRLRSSELERTIYESEQAVGAQTGEADSLRREVDKLRREALERAREMRKRDDEARELVKLREESVENLEKMMAELTKERRDTEVLAGQLSDLNAKLEEWDQNLRDSENRNAALEETLKKSLLDKANELEEKDKALEEMKVRDAHMQKINKALKEEIRKLSRAMGATTPSSSTPPLSARNSIIDPSDVSAAQRPSQQPSRRASSSSLGSSPTSPTPPSSSVPPPYPGTSNSNRLSTISLASNGSTNPPPVGSYEGLNEAAKMEYLKNLVLKFLESRKEKRMHMIPALSMLLQLSPDEVRKVQRNA
ncbi:hypothetical protein HDU97_007819 [Phlyctochytrium planicorne]|nr:hypothetical protein HDU97_007819 [Phlyctochytrium planicorne]